MKLQNKKKEYVLRIQKKKEIKTSIKTHEWNGMTDIGVFGIFSNVHVENAIYFAPVGTTTCGMKNNKSSMSLEMGAVNARTRAQLLNMLYNSTHLSVPHGQNI